jgi:cytochrome P450
MTTFDHHSVEFAAGWRDELRDMRQHCPVAHTDAHDSYWIVTKYADAQRVLRDHKVFASARDLVGDGWSTSGGVTIPTNQGRMGFMEMDPPESLAYRKIINPWMSRLAVREYRPRITEIVDWAIDQFIEDGTVDVVTQLANPIPAIVTLDVLGIDLVDWRTYAEAAHGAAFREPGSGTKLKWMMQNVRELVRDGAHDPLGLIASWKAATVGGEPLSDNMVCELIFMVINGGTDTTTSLIANSIVELQRRTDLRQRLVDEPALVPAAVQELLRYCVPSTGVARTTLAPTEIGQCPIGAGERVLLLLASTNFDDEQFPHPDVLDFDRPSNQHLSFGTGGHRCVGAELATAELEVFLERFLSRIPEFRVDLDRVQAYPTMPLVNGHIVVPTTFSPARRVSPISELPHLTQPRLRPID